MTGKLNNAILQFLCADVVASALANQGALRFTLRCLFYCLR